MQTSVCAISKAPAVFNNKLVKVRGYVIGNFEYSVLVDETCPGEGIWFLFADGSGYPALVAYAEGRGKPAGDSKDGRPAEPIEAKLVKDSSYDQLVRYWRLSEKGKTCADGPPSADALPDCTTYRVTATFVGHVDGASEKVRTKHGKQNNARRDGFGLMGVFKAQIVVHSVEDVAPVDEAELLKGTPKSQ